MSVLFVDKNKNGYFSITDYKHHKIAFTFTEKQLFQKDPKLVIFDANDREIFRMDHIQMLYLYPLNLLDYVEGIKKNKTVMYYMPIFSDKINYIELFKKRDLSFLKNVEITIESSYSSNKLKRIIALSSYLKSKNIKISFNLKSLLIDDKILSSLFHIGFYFKIFLDCHYATEEYKIFLKKLSLLKENDLSQNKLVHVKSYLNLQDEPYYESIICDFIQEGVSVFQVSKELIEDNKMKNPSVPINCQQRIRTLEEKYQGEFQFISVKDISTLYYPRFELDERNSRNCYACYLKPYLFNDDVLPCKVRDKIAHREKWKLSNLSMNYDMNVIKRCGTECDDCASIFENDALQIIMNYLPKDGNILLEVEG